VSSLKMAGNKTNKGFMIALASAVVLSFTGIIIKMVSEDYQLPALILAFWRDFFVVICAFPFLLLLKPQLLKVQKNNDLPSISSLSVSSQQQQYPFLIYFN